MKTFAELVALCKQQMPEEVKPLYATLEDRMFGRAQRDMTDEEKKDLEIYCDGHPLAKYAREAEAMNRATDQRVIDLLCAKNNRLREALKFYADENNYLPHEFYPDNSPVDIDSGKIARAALEQKR
jgi:hypothetical protein